MIRLLIVIGMLAYTLSPIDLIPDVVPVIGWLDDLGIDVIGLITVYVLGQVKREEA